MAVENTAYREPGVFELLALYATLGWRNIWRHPRRSILTFLAVSLGLLVFILTRATQFGTYDKIIEKAVRTSTGHIQIHGKGYLENRSFDEAMYSYGPVLAVLDADPDVKIYTVRINSEALIASDGGTTGTAVIGIDPEREFKVTILPERMKEGETVRGRGDIIIGERMARSLKVSLGDELILVGSGADGSLGADRFRLSGIFATGVADFDRSVAMIHIEDADRLFSMGGAITEISLLLRDFSLVDETAERLKTALAGENVEVHTWKELLPEMVQMITLDNVGGLIMLWFFFIVVVAVILNTILITTLERVKEFGIMLSLGLKPSRIFFMILFEAAVLVTLGTVMGLALAWTIGEYLEAHPIRLSEELARGLEEMFMSPFIYTKMSITLLLSWGGAVFIASLVVALYPAIKVARLTPLKAMHPERGEL